MIAPLASAPDARSVLEARARRLAESREPDSTAPRTALITFRVGHEELGLDARDVEGVFRLRHLTPLPGAPAAVAGVTSWRGRALTVLDVEQAMGIPRSGLDDRVWVLGLAVDGTRLGLLATSVGEIREIEDAEILPLERKTSPAVVGRTDDALLVVSGRALLAGLLQGEVR